MEALTGIWGIWVARWIGDSTDGNGAPTCLVVLVWRRDGKLLLDLEFGAWNLGGTIGLIYCWKTGVYIGKELLQEAGHILMTENINFRVDWDKLVIGKTQKRKRIWQRNINFNPKNPTVMTTQIRE
jgi:hypothetical protein